MPAVEELNGKLQLKGNTNEASLILSQDGSLYASIWWVGLTRDQLGQLFSQIQAVRDF